MPNDLSIDQARRLLFQGGEAFDPQARRWTSAAKRIAGEPIGLRDAVRWLQSESGSPCRVPVAVIGPRDANAAQREAAFAVGAGLGRFGLVLLCGGKGGVMEAACEGAASAGGISVGLLPEGEWQAANRFVTIPIATGIGEARNALIARAALALIAIGASYGTLSEIALALKTGVPVVGLGTWEIDGVEPAGSPADAVKRAINR